MIYAPETKQVGAGKWLVIALAFFSAFMVVSTFYVIYSYRHSIPYQDYWRTVKLYDAYLQGSLGAEIFWEQNGEHRILFPRILFLLDYLVAHGTGYLLIALNLLLQGFQAFLIGKSLWKHKDFSKNDRLFFSLAAVVICFWLVQSGNLIWSFQITWFLNGIMASVASFSVAGMDRQAKNSSNWNKIILAAFCSLVAAYSLANGIFMCIVLLGVLWKSRLPRGMLIFWIAFVAALGVSYLGGYHSPADPSSLFDLFHLRTLHYFLAYLGNPVSRFYLPAGTALGVLGLGVYFVFSWRFITARESVFLEKFGFAQTTYVVVTAMVTTVGRNQEGAYQATSSRYYTPVLIFWFFLLILVYAHNSKREKARKGILIGTFLVFLAFVLPIQLGAVSQRAIRYVKNDESSLALVTGVQDSSVLNYQLCPDDSTIWEQNDFLRNHRLSVYREPWTLTLGRNLYQEYGLDSSKALEGEAKVIRTLDAPFHGGYFVQGEIRMLPGVAPPEVILFANRDTITGYARTTRRLCRGCFSGYVRGLENESFQMFGLQEAGGITLISTTP